MAERVRMNIADRAKVPWLLAQFPRLFLTSPKFKRWRETMYQRVGMVALMIIQQEFLKKSAGGADESGLKWPPLALSTIAKRRAGRMKGAVKGKHGRRIGRKLARYMVHGTIPILRDTSLLFNSLAPGTRKVANQIFEIGERSVTVGTEVRSKRGFPYAAAHHADERGNAKFPQRRLWPKWENWPPQWKQQLLNEANAVMIEAMVDYLQNWKRYV